jgi:adenine-specific DNA methylase
MAEVFRERMVEWQARNIVPEEEVPFGYETSIRWPIDKYGIRRWTDMFSPRQLHYHCASVAVFQDLVADIAGVSGALTEMDRAALAYVALALDKMVNYNSLGSHWDPSSERVRGKFDRHDFSFKWSYGEMAPTTAGVGHDWIIDQTGKALGELIELLGHTDEPTFDHLAPSGRVQVYCGSGDALPLAAACVDCIVMDPPYYNNVTYSELSDFFYVWLKRTAGLLYPDLFADPLTNKDREAVANPARFAGQQGALDLAGADYEERMAAIFIECRRVLKPGGVMTVMFTHKATGAWDALAGGLIKAGFIITASWPINTEAEGSLHIRDKASARSTIFLVCRARDESKPDADEVTHWEDVEPKVAAAVRRRVAEFQEAGIRGVDLYLASFGPALQVFSEYWPLKRGRARQEQPGRQKRLFEKRDPYEVRAEDALEAARREVKNWRMQQLASLQRQHQMDPLTEWFVLAWDAFRAPRFPSDEAIKLARVVGLDFEKQVKNVVCEIKGDDVVLWDSKERKARGKLTQAGDGCMLDALHFAAAAAREQRSTEVGKAVIERANLLGDPNLMVALQALLNVLPPPAAPSKKGESRASGAAADFAALELLRRLAFAKEVPPPPDLPEQFSLALEEE